VPPPPVATQQVATPSYVVAQPYLYAPAPVLMAPVAYPGFGYGYWYGNRFWGYRQGCAFYGGRYYGGYAPNYWRPGCGGWRGGYARGAWGGYGYRGYGYR
jgi:hypothetical protein